MRKLIIAIFTLVASQTLAAERTEPEMKAIAAYQLAGAQVKAGNRGTGTVPQELRRTSTYRIYGSDNLGFAVVSSDDLFPAILGYSTTRFDSEHIPCGLQWWLDAVDFAMQHPTRAEVRRTVQEYPIIENFVTTLWGQDDPYNWLCPEINGRPTPSGCVATATSQIMCYYRYPEQGKGKGGYYIEPSKTRMPADINGTYLWDQMRDSYTGIYVSDALREPVAILLRDVGYGVFMSYGTGGSGAYSENVAKALADNFSYNPLSLRHYYREYFSPSEWMSLITEELRAGRPVYYAAADEKSGGHAFFFSGMDAEGKVYVNWGWNGIGNGYYDISSLTPTGILGQPGTQNYALNQHMVIGIKPQPEPEEGEYYASHICMPDSFTVKRFGQKLQCGIPTFYNFGFRSFDGVIGYYFMPTEAAGDAPTFITAYDTQNSGIVASGYGDKVATRLIDVSSLAAGEYKVYVAVLDKLQGDYEFARSLGGVRFYPLTKAEDGTLTVGLCSLVDGVSAPHSASPDTTQPSDLQTRVYDTSGRIVYTSPTSQFNLWDVPDRGILVVKQGGKVRKVVR